MDDIDLKSKFKVSGQVLQSLFENGKSPLSEHFLRWKLWSKWKDLMGDSISESCEPVGYSNKKLYIFVRNSTLLHHMYFLKGNMIRKIKKDFHKDFVNEIIFTLDRKKIPSDELEKEKLKNSLAQLIKNEEDE